MTGQTISVAIRIQATPAEVWQVLEPIERHVEWMADAESIRFIGKQERGEGTRFVCATKIGPLRLQDHMEITEWVPEHSMGVRHKGLVTGSGRFTLSAREDGATQFIWRETLQFPWWLGGPVAGILGGKLVLRAIWKRNIRALRAMVEDRQTAPT